jgi:hypothetical protein
VFYKHFLFWSLGSSDGPRWFNLILNFCVSGAFWSLTENHLMSHSTLMSSHLLKYHINELSKKRKSGAHDNFIRWYDVGLVCPIAFVWIWVLCVEYGYSVLSTLNGRGWSLVSWLVAPPVWDDCEHGLPVRSHVAFAHTKSTDSMSIIMWQLNLDDFCAIELWLKFVN